MIATLTVWIVRLKMFRGRQKPALGQPGERIDRIRHGSGSPGPELKDRADDHEGADHAQKTGVDFKGLEQGPPLRWRG
jgi:hypothetical protein